MTRTGLALVFALALLVEAPAFAQTRPSAGAAAAERRTALVIGNAEYPAAPLRNPGNDARKMGHTLRELGFDVTFQENVTQNQMRRLIIQFGDKIREGGIGLFFYAGHGMQVGGRNYMIPVDADVKSEAEVEVDGVDVAAVLARMETARNKLNIVILDACRDNPFIRRFRSSAKGLASIDAPVGTLIAYATAPGSLAFDGTGPNSFYTGELAEAMRTPGLRVEEVFKRVRQAVRVKTQGKQIPWEASSLEGEFVFAERREPPAPAPRVAAAPAAPPPVAAPAQVAPPAPPVTAPPPRVTAPPAPSRPGTPSPPTTPPPSSASRPIPSPPLAAPAPASPGTPASPPPLAAPPLATPAPATPPPPVVAAIPPDSPARDGRERAASLVRVALQRRSNVQRPSGGAIFHDRLEIHDLSAARLSLTVHRTIMGGGRTLDGKHGTQRVETAFDKLDVRSTKFNRGGRLSARNSVDLCFESRDVALATSDLFTFPDERYVCFELQASSEAELGDVRTALELLSGKTLAPIK